VEENRSELHIFRGSADCGVTVKLSKSRTTQYYRVRRTRCPVSCLNRKPIGNTLRRYGTVKPARRESPRVTPSDRRPPPETHKVFARRRIWRSKISATIRFYVRYLCTRAATRERALGNHIRVYGVFDECVRPLPTEGGSMTNENLNRAVRSDVSVEEITFYSVFGSSSDSRCCFSFGRLWI